MNATQILVWCREHNARVRWHSGGGVSVMVNFETRRRVTLEDAIFAVCEKTGVPFPRGAHSEYQRLRARR